MARAKQEKAKRRPFGLVLDEFQTFVGTAGASYEKILSRARKYRLRLVLAHQNSGQIPTDLFREIVGTVSTTVCFQVSAADARRFSRDFVIERDGEIGNIPYEQILRLHIGEAWCKMGEHVFRMRTYLARENGSKHRADEVIERSRQTYGARAAPVADTAPSDAENGIGEGTAAGDSDDDFD